MQLAGCSSPVISVPALSYARGGSGGRAVWRSPSGGNQGSKHPGSDKVKMHIVPLPSTHARSIINGRKKKCLSIGGRERRGERRGHTDLPTSHTSHPKG